MSMQALVLSTNVQPLTISFTSPAPVEAWWTPRLLVSKMQPRIVCGAELNVVWKPAPALSWISQPSIRTDPLVPTFSATPLDVQFLISVRLTTTDLSNANECPL